MSNSGSSSELKSLNMIRIIYFDEELCSRRKTAASSLDRSAGFELVWRASSFKDDKENGDREAMQFSMLFDLANH